METINAFLGTNIENDFLGWAFLISATGGLLSSIALLYCVARTLICFNTITRAKTTRKILNN